MPQLTPRRDWHDGPSPCLRCTTGRTGAGPPAPAAGHRSGPGRPGDGASCTTCRIGSPPPAGRAARPVGGPRRPHHRPQARRGSASAHGVDPGRGVRRGCTNPRRRRVYAAVGARQGGTVALRGPLPCVRHRGRRGRGGAPDRRAGRGQPTAAGPRGRPGPPPGHRGGPPPHRRGRRRPRTERGLCRYAAPWAGAMSSMRRASPKSRSVSRPPAACVVTATATDW